MYSSHSWLEGGNDILLYTTLTITIFSHLGSVFYYCLIQITLWWFFHISALFWAFRFPVHFRSYVQLHRIRYIHAVCVLLGLVIPVLPVVVTLGDYATDEKTSSTPTGFGFGLTNFPPVLCAGLDPDASFYSLVLPITVLTEIGMTLLVFTFWDVRKVGDDILFLPFAQKECSRVYLSCPLSLTSRYLHHTIL